MHKTSQIPFKNEALTHLGGPKCCSLPFFGEVVVRAGWGATFDAHWKQNEALVENSPNKVHWRNGALKGQCFQRQQQQQQQQPRRQNSPGSADKACKILYGKKVPGFSVKQVPQEAGVQIAVKYGLTGFSSPRCKVQMCIHGIKLYTDATKSRTNSALQNGVHKIITAIQGMEKPDYRAQVRTHPSGNAHGDTYMQLCTNIYSNQRKFRWETSELRSFKHAKTSVK